MKKSPTRPSYEILVLPGWAIPPAYYMPLLSALKSRNRASVFDYGFFPEVASGFPMRLPELSPDSSPLLVLGHSMGSLLALKLAASCPAVKGLILFNPFARFSESPSVPGRRIEDILSMKTHLGENAESLLKSFYRAAAAPEPMKMQPPEFLNVKALSEGLEFLLEADASSSAQSLRVPALGFSSGSDSIVDAAMASALSGMAPALQMKPVTGAGHMLPATRPLETAALIDAFLAQSFPKGLK